MVGRAALGFAAAAALAVPAAAETPANGKLSVHVQQVRKKRDGFYIEGALQFLVVKRAGEVVLRRRINKGTHTFLSIGRYWISSYTQICDANCGNLDPPMFRCARRLEVRGGDRIRMTLRVRVGHRCSIHFERT